MDQKPHQLAKRSTKQQESIKMWSKIKYMKIHQNSTLKISEKKLDGCFSNSQQLI